MFLLFFLRSRRSNSSGIGGLEEDYYIAYFPMRFKIMGNMIDP